MTILALLMNKLNSIAHLKKCKEEAGTWVVIMKKRILFTLNQRNSSIAVETMDRWLLGQLLEVNIVNRDIQLIEETLNIQEMAVPT